MTTDRFRKRAAEIDRTVEAKLPKKLAEALQRSAQILQELRLPKPPAELVKALEVMSPKARASFRLDELDFNQIAWDLIVILNPRRREERERAARRIAKKLGPIIDQKRWKWIRPELRRLARMHRRSERDELESLILSGLFETIERELIGRILPGEIEEIFKELRPRMKNLVIEDLLGPDWRKRTFASKLQEVELSSTLSGPNLIAQVEARLLLESLLGRAKLSTGEKEVFSARAFQDMSFKAIASKLKIETPYARVLYGRAIAKIKKNS